MAKIKNLFIATSMETYFLFWPLATLAIFIQEIAIRTKLIWHWKVMDQIDTIERIKTILKYDVKYKDQIYSLPYNYNINLKIMKKKKKKKEHIDQKKKKKKERERETLLEN